MPKLRPLMMFTLPLLAAGAAFGQCNSNDSAMVSDRPGLLFSSVSVCRGTFLTEWGLPAVALDSSGGVDVRLASLVGLVRYGVTDNVELRLGGPVYNEVRVSVNGRSATERGAGDLEVGAKWHLVDNRGGRPSFALIPSVIVPTGEKGFTADHPVYQLNAIAEWTLANDWGLGALAGYLNGPTGDRRHGQETFGVSLGRSLPSPKWSAYGEAVYVATNLDGTGDSSFLGGGVKYLVMNDFQVDLNFDRGLSADSPDWLFGFGVSARFH